MVSRGHAALCPLAGPLWATWGHARPHLYAVTGTARPFGEVLTLLAGRDWDVEFAATTLLVSQRLNERYLRRLAQPLAGGAGQPPQAPP